MPLLDEVVLPVFAKNEVPVLVAPAAPNQVIVPCNLDAKTSARVLVRVIMNDDGQDLQLWVDLCEVPRAQRGHVLDVMNTLNARWRWLKFVLLDDVAVVQFDVALGDDAQAQDRFESAFGAYMGGLHAHWSELVRAASRRGRRSRLERELDGLLAEHPS
jgi:Putative bacterial sensory transduction regulator